ncbi:MAG: hypothetical protein ACRDRA_05385 [Pseudonocardiaceae bacterium]
MSVPQGSPPSEVTGHTTARSLRQRTVRVFTAFLLMFAFVLAGAPAALAGPGCPDKPGVCAPSEWLP